MGSYLLIVSVCSLLLTLNAVTARPSSHKLDRVFIVLRHGHRSPMHWYPTHPKAPETTGKFLHKLTPLGEEMATQQGLRMKKIYKELLGVDRILPEWVESFTSNTSRTNRTGVRFLNAFTDSSDSRLTTLPTLSDFTISQFAPCKNYEKLSVEKLKDTPEDYKVLIELIRPLLQELEQLAGFNMGNLRNPARLYDVVLSEALLGNEQPEWTKKVYPDGLAALAAARLGIFADSKEMLYMKSAPLIGEIRRFMKTDQGDYKFRLMTGHDSTLVTLARAFEMDDQVPILFNFTAIMAFELYKDPEGSDGFVKVVHYPIDSKDSVELIPKGCEGSVCSWKTFSGILAKLGVDPPYDAMCGNPEGYTYSEEFLAIRNVYQPSINEIPMEKEPCKLPRSKWFLNYIEQMCRK